MEAKAALFFLEGHYQLNWREGSVERTKFLSPAQIGRAFSDKDAFDSGWLEANVIAFRSRKENAQNLERLAQPKTKDFHHRPAPADEREDG